MEMSPQYAADTAQFAASRGYRLEVSTRDAMQGDILGYRSTQYRLVAEPEIWTLEVAAYPDGEVRYYLEIERYHGLRSRSFPLDSWKFRESHIEFRYQAHPKSGLALTFELAYPDCHDVTPPSRS